MLKWKIHEEFDDEIVRKTLRKYKQLIIMMKYVRNVDDRKTRVHP